MTTASPTFATLDESQLRFIETIEIDDCIIFAKDVKDVQAALELKGKTREELTAIRNTVVRHLADLGTRAREVGDWSVFDRSRTNMSGITAVIDHMIYC